MEKISVLIPCYNEDENVLPLSNDLVNIFEKELANYDYEIVFIDNCSVDNTQKIIRGICKSNNRIKAIFNAKNFGAHNSGYYGLFQTTGDCVILLNADYQDPIELIPDLVNEWKKGNKIVSCIKKKSRENKLVRFIRTCYYKTLKKMSEVDQIEHFTGFGLYDRSFIEILKNIQEPLPFLRGIVAEYGFKRKEINYVQQKRRGGKTKANLYNLYDLAMLNFTSYTKIGLRIATILGFIIGGITFLIAIIYFIYKLLYWDSFSLGIAPLIIGVFFFGSIQLFFIGLIGEYIMAINNRLRLLNRPLVIEEERINFD